MRKSFQLLAILIGILWCTINQSAAQTETESCPTPTSISFTTEQAACFGAGTVTVTQINGEAAPSNGTMRYQLDSADGNNKLHVVKDWQTNPVFTEVTRGSYFINVQQVCGLPNGGVSDSLQSAQVTVSGTVTNIYISDLTKLQDAVCNNEGSFTVEAAGGSGSYRYALVASQNEDDEATDYVRPPQASDTFSNLPAGTYYVRVYDTCDTYATAPYTVNTVSDAPWSLEIGGGNTGKTVYSCDSMSLWLILIKEDRTTSGAPDPAERLWVQVGKNGVADTITGWSYSAYTANAVRVDRYPMFKFTVYPDTVYVGYKSACGNIYTDYTIIQKPKIGIQYRSLGSSNCDNSLIQVSLMDSANSVTPYYNGRLSIDSGRTWSPVNHNGYTFSDTLLAGQTYYVWATGSCGDTVKSVFQVPIPYITLALTEANGYACPGNSGFAIQVTNYSGAANQILFTVLKQPDSKPLPESFYDSVYSSGSTATGIPYINNAQYTYNLPLGTYVIQAQDACGSSAKDTVILDTPKVQTYTVQPSPNCSLPTQNGFTLTSKSLNQLVVYPVIYSPIVNVIITNTATGQKDSTSSNSLINGSTLFGKTNLTAGTYNIKVVNKPYYPQYLLPRNYYPTCYWDTTVTLTSGGPLEAPTMLATSSCGNGTSSAVAVSITGGSGSGSYTYQLQSTTDDGNTWSDVGEAQPTGIFSGLSKETQYQIVVTDTCGNLTNAQVSFNSTPLMLTYSTIEQPCTNDEFTMTLPLIDGATYAWTANGETIAGATSNNYTVTVPDADNIVTYIGQINLGDCIIMSQPYTLDPGNCNTPLAAPITGLQLNAQVQANNAVQLSWETKMEINSKHFTVQRSADGGKTWTNVGTVATKAVNGNSSTSLSYTLTDANVQPGSYEYQVLETDINGGTTTSNVVPVQITAGAKVYPIPASTYVRIFLPAGVSNVPYRMISTDGKVVLSGTMSNQGSYGQISVSGLASAVYFLQVTINNAVQTYKVQVQH